jgi:hypothetical protein
MRVGGHTGYYNICFSDFVNPDVYLQLEKTKRLKLFYLKSPINYKKL